MMSKFNQNAIINGLIDYFCLVCETYFATEDAAEQHIDKQVHKKNLESSTYMEKYKSDCVRKVRTGYFCEYCNMLLSTGTKVSLHIEENTHQNNKGIALLKYVENDVVAFNDLVIKEEAWHGFSGDTCAICNCDVEEFADHKSNLSHILNLVQGKIQFGPDKNVYRKVDESTFQCLTCNKILASNTFQKHFNDAEHQKMYANCIKNKTKDSHNMAENKQSRNPTTGEESSLDENTMNSNILDSIPEFQKNDININFESEKAFCKKCYVEVCFDYNEINKHIIEHKNNKASPLSSPARVDQNYKTMDVQAKSELDHDKLNTDMKYLTFYDSIDTDQNVHEEEISCEATPKDSNSEYTNEPDSIITIETFADNNKISYIAGNSEAHCTACNVKLPATLRNMTEHVNGTTHKVKSVPVKKPKCSGAHLPKIRMNEYIKEVVHVQNICGHDVVINDEYCLTSMSFLMIREDGFKLNCLYCDIIFDEINIKQHLKSSSHDGAMDRTPVVISDDDEFVREIRSGVYHCGYCNLVVGDWSDFQEHGKSENHAQTKKTMKYRFNVHKPEVLEHRRNQKLRVVLEIMRNRFDIPSYWN